MLYLGLLAGTYSAYAAGRAEGMSGERFMVAILALLVPAVLGARLAFVASRWSAYRAQPRRILLPGKEGGAVAYGALAQRSGVGAAPDGARASVHVVLGRRSVRLPGGDHLPADRMLLERLLLRPRGASAFRLSYWRRGGRQCSSSARYWPQAGCPSRARSSCRRSLPMRQVGSSSTSGETRRARWVA